MKTDLEKLEALCKKDSFEYNLWEIASHVPSLISELKAAREIIGMIIYIANQDSNLPREKVELIYKQMFKLIEDYKASIGEKV